MEIFYIWNIFKCIIEKHNNVYIGYIPIFKGLVVEGKCIEEVKNELEISLKVKLIYDYKLEIS